MSLGVKMQLNVHSKPMQSHTSFVSEMFWNNQDVDLFLNPKLPALMLDQSVARVQEFLSHKRLNMAGGFVGLATSGATRQTNVEHEAAEQGAEVVQKILLLSKYAILASAQMVIDHFGLGEEAWILNLPLHHIGGLSVLARAFLMKTNCIYMDGWDPQRLVEVARLSRTNNIAVSLVPTQIYDIVQAGLQCPTNIRRVFVGGGQMSEVLYAQISQLNWPVVQTYGMTETSAMMAEYDFQRKIFQSLRGVSVRVSSEGRLMVATPGLFSCELSVQGTRIISDEFYLTDDLAEIVEDGRFRLNGRIQNQVKILGELVNVTKVEQKVLTELGVQAHQATVVAVADARREHKLILYIEKTAAPHAESWLENYNRAAIGYERIESMKVVESLPKTDLGKINKNYLR